MQHYIGTKIIKAEESNGGYKVVYKDGYESWSPKEAFEEAYKPLTGLTFGLAIEAMKKGKAVARKGWNGNGIFIKLHIPGPMCKMTQSFIYIDTTGLDNNNPDVKRGRVPWLASQTDMLARDWYVKQ